MKVEYESLFQKRKVTEEDIEHLKRIIAKNDGEDVPEGYLESMDTIEWVDKKTILVGTYGFLSDREWEFDMENDTYKLVSMS